MDRRLLKNSAANHIVIDERLQATFRKLVVQNSTNHPEGM
jgi:hypothetical protein